MSTMSAMIVRSLGSGYGAMGRMAAFVTWIVALDEGSGGVLVVRPRLPARTIGGMTQTQRNGSGCSRVVSPKTPVGRGVREVGQRLLQLVARRPRQWSPQRRRRPWHQIPQVVGAAVASIASVDELLTRVAAAVDALPSS